MDELVRRASGASFPWADALSTPPDTSYGTCAATGSAQSAASAAAYSAYEDYIHTWVQSGAESAFSVARSGTGMDRESTAGGNWSTGTYAGHMWTTSSSGQGIAYTYQVPFATYVSGRSEKKKEEENQLPSFDDTFMEGLITT